MSRRIVAPTPPATTKPTPKAAAVAAGSLPLRLAMLPTPSRRSSTEAARRSRSASMSRRTCSAVRVLLETIVPPRLAPQLRLADRQLPCDRRSLLDRHQLQPAEKRD